MALSDELASTDNRRALTALRRVLAERIAEGVRARDLAALSLRLMRVVAALEALEGPPVRRARRRT